MTRLSGRRRLRCLFDFQADRGSLFQSAFFRGAFSGGRFPRWRTNCCPQPRWGIKRIGCKAI